MRHNGLKLALMTALGVLIAGCSMTPEEEAAAIERELLELPDGGDLFGAIKEEYPEDLADLVDRVQGLSLAERNGTAGQQLGTQFIQEFMTKIGPEAVRAPAEELLIWSATEAELYEALQRSATEACANMTMGSWVFIDEDNKVARAAIQRRNVAMIRAAAAGRDDPQDYGEPSEAQLNQLGDAIAATGLDPDLQATLGNIQAMLELSPTDQCDLGVAYYQGISALPDEIEPTIAAYMFTPE